MAACGLVRLSLQGPDPPKEAQGHSALAIFLGSGNMQRLVNGVRVEGN